MTGGAGRVSARQQLAVQVELGGRTAWIRGHHSVVVKAIKAARSPRQFDAKQGCWRIPRQFVDDVCAAIELQAGADVHVEQVDR